MSKLIKFKVDYSNKEVYDPIITSILENSRTYTVINNHEPVHIIMNKVMYDSLRSECNKYLHYTDFVNNNEDYKLSKILDIKIKVAYNHRTALGSDNYAFINEGGIILE